MECMGTSFPHVNGTYIKQEPDPFPSGFEQVYVKSEPLETNDYQEDLSGFDAHAWALDHLKTEIAEEPTCPYNNGNTNLYTDSYSSVPSYGQMHYEYGINPFYQPSMMGPPAPLPQMYIPPPPLPPSKPYPCCENAWLNKEKQFHCEVCHKNFSTKGNLGNHMRSHTQERPFQCNICGRCFSFNCNLKTHYLTHTGLKPFQCSVCGKRFSTKGNMSVHLRIHTGERPYKCEICFKTFTVKDNLQRHLKTHIPLSL